MKNRATEEYSRLQSAVFGGGCFWCIESAFSQLKGVRNIVSGYSGGSETSGDPTYEKVCSGKTGHAEVVRIEYDPKVISYTDLLSVFFALHDPTTLNRQGADTGSQYCSIILYSDEKQRKEADEFIEKLEEDKTFDDPIVTEVKKLEKFFPAEDYHQDFFKKNSEKPYCQINISPKIAKLREKFGNLLKK